MSTPNASITRARELAAIARVELSAFSKARGGATAFGHLQHAGDSLDIAASLVHEVIAQETGRLFKKWHRARARKRP